MLRLGYLKSGAKFNYSGELHRVGREFNTFNSLLSCTREADGKQVWIHIDTNIEPVSKELFRQKEIEEVER